MNGDLTLNEFGHVLFTDHEGHHPFIIKIYNLVFDNSEVLLSEHKNSKREDPIILATVMPVIFDMIQLMLRLPNWNSVNNVVNAFGNCFKDLQAFFIECLSLSFQSEDKISVAGSDLEFIKGVSVGLFSLCDNHNQFIMRTKVDDEAWRLLHRLCSIKLDGRMLATAIKDDRGFMNLLRDKMRNIFDSKNLSDNEKRWLKNGLALFNGSDLNLVGEALVSELFYSVVKPTAEKEKINLLLNM